MPLPELTLAAAARAGLAAAAEADVLAVPVRRGPDGPMPGSGAEEVARAYDVALGDHLVRAQRAGEAGEAGQVTALPVSAPGRAADELLIVGVDDGSAPALRRAGAALARRARGRRTLATTVADGADDEGVRAFAEGLLLGSYSYAGRRGSPRSPAPVERVQVLVERPAGRQSALHRAGTTGRAVARARDLANTPSDEKDPSWLAERAAELAREVGLDTRIRDERELADEGFGGIVAVGAGSARPPRLIELSYRPAGGRQRRGRHDAPRPAPHVVLIGKGVTFDSGGLSLKPREAMVPMKTDMAAGGAVLAAMGALRDLDVGTPVTALVAAAENLPGAAAQRPGDVIRHYGGRTVEVLNTDAEGRLVLADALAYADRALAPDVVVDLATLTGAASLGLGRRHGALYTADDALAAELTVAGEASGERVWRMPLVEDYRPVLDSPVADLANVARDPTVSGGSIVAALFLREFTGGRRWAHLDIAGPARAEADEHEVTKGGTGFGVRLLLRWLEGLSRA